MNWLPPNESKAWPIIYLVVFVASFILCAIYLYDSGFVLAKDGTTLLTILAALAAAAGFRNFAAPDSKDKPDK